MTDGAYIYQQVNGTKQLTVWTRDGVVFDVQITDLVTFESQNIYLPGFDMAKAIIKAMPDD